MVPGREVWQLHPPQLIWFDWWIEQPAFAPYLRRFAAYYCNRGAEWNREVAINYKHQAFPEKATVLDIERGQLTDTVYAVALGVPECDLTIQSLGTNLRLHLNQIGDVQLLGSDGPVRWSRDESGLHITLPNGPPRQHAVALKILPR